MESLTEEQKKVADAAMKVWPLALARTEPFIENYESERVRNLMAMSYLQGMRDGQCIDGPAAGYASIVKIIESWLKHESPNANEEMVEILEVAKANLDRERKIAQSDLYTPLRAKFQENVNTNETGE
jgi:hypothetical protein